jgi:hypothetical protein
VGKDEGSRHELPSHGMEDWSILHLFYNALIPMLKSMLDTALGGTFMSKQD